MDVSRARKFNEKMGKVQKFSKGGMIRKIAGRHYFDVGGSTTIAPATSSPNVVSSGVNGLMSPGINTVAGVAAPVGQAATGLAADFTAQNGYQAQLAPTTQSNYQPVIAAGSGAATNGYNQFNQNLSQEQALSGQLGQIAAGQGPNPAQTALNQNTATNVANQAALMAGQRGAGANAGLIARQAAQQGAATQQQAVGQEATNQANQSLNALGQQATLQQGIGSQITGEQNANTSLLGTSASAQNAQNNSNIANTGMVQGINSQVAQNNTNSVNQSESGLLGGVGSALGLADGGEVLGTPEPTAPTITPPNLMTPAPSSSSENKSPGGSIGKLIGGGGGGDSEIADAAAMSRGGNVMKGPHGHVAAYLASGGAVPAMLSPGEKYLSPDEVQKVVKEGANPLKLGKTVPGKAKTKKDSLKNDIFPATLQEGGVVLPKHIMNKKSRDHAELFVHKAVHMRAPKGKN